MMQINLTNVLRSFNSRGYNSETEKGVVELLHDMFQFQRVQFRDHTILTSAGILAVSIPEGTIQRCERGNGHCEICWFQFQRVQFRVHTSCKPVSLCRFQFQRVQFRVTCVASFVKFCRVSIPEGTIQSLLHEEHDKEASLFQFQRVQFRA